MTVMELLRGIGAPGGTSAPRVPLHRTALAGAGAALASAAVVVLPALLVWVASAQSTVEWTQALGVGASLWLLGQGAHLTLGGAHLALAPLLFLAGAVAGASWAARRALAEPAEEAGGQHVWGLLPGPFLRAVVGWAAGYAGCAGLVALLTLTGPLRPVPWSLAVPVLAVPLVAAAWAASRHAAATPGLAGERWRWPAAVPGALRRSLWPAVVGTSALLAVGVLLALALVVVHLHAVTGLQGQLGAGVVGGTVLAAVQVLALPNLGLWAVSFVAGTGVEVVQGATLTWTGARGGVMPMVPVLGALPQPGAFPGVLPALVLLPVGIGALVGWRSLRAVARLSGLRTKATVAGLAVTLTAAAVGLLDALGGGSLGARRLADIGAPAGAMALALLVELALGAALVLAWDHWRLRR